MMSFSEIEHGIRTIQDKPDESHDPAGTLLSLSEKVLEIWLKAHQLEPTFETLEGFRLLALHRQGAINNPSFHACRETCRELLYQVNLYHSNKNLKQIRLAAMVAMHLLLFIRGKMEVQELGEFCCNSRTNKLLTEV